MHSLYMNKHFRHNKILSLLRTEAVASQMDLGRKLKSQGVQVTQSTLSRDLRELNLIKTSQGYQPPEGVLQIPGTTEQQRSMILQFMTAVEVAGQLVVLKTQPGNASPVARSLDTIGWTEIVGTVAGDDTILVVSPSSAAARLVKKRLLRLGSMSQSPKRTG